MKSLQVKIKFFSDNIPDWDSSREITGDKLLYCGQINIREWIEKYYSSEKEIGNLLIILATCEEFFYKS